MFFHSRGKARTPLTRLLNPPVLRIDNAISPLYEEYAISPLRHLHRGSPLCPEHRPACASKIWRSAPDGGLGEAFHNQRIRFQGYITPTAFQSAVGVFWHQPSGRQTHRPLRQGLSGDGHLCHPETAGVCICSEEHTSE